MPSEVARPLVDPTNSVPMVTSSRPSRPLDMNNCTRSRDARISSFRKRSVCNRTERLKIDV